MIDLRIETKWSKTADINIRHRLRDVKAIQEANALHIVARMRQGRAATIPEGYSTNPTAGPRKAPRYFVSPAYALKVGLADERRFRSSAAMHARVAARPGQARVSGGMWSGLQVRNFGADAVMIDFGGSTLGASSTKSAILKRKTGSYQVTLSENGKLRARQMREFARTGEGKVKTRSSPKLVRNDHKAAAVFRHSNIGVLENTQAEVDAISSAWANAAGVLVARSFGARGTAAPSGDMRLFSAVFRELTR